MYIDRRFLNPFFFKKNQHPVEVVHIGENDPVRCQRCGGYINPFVVFIDGGLRFICNLCSFTNEGKIVRCGYLLWEKGCFFHIRTILQYVIVPQDYFCNLDLSGKRSDLAQRPELRYGTIDFVASQDYCSRQPKPISYIVAMNVSFAATRSGLLNYYVAAIKKVLDHLTTDPKFDQVKFGLITFDTSVQFYNFDVSILWRCFFLKKICICNRTCFFSISLL
jgi:protein transport protein SEC24